MMQKAGGQKTCRFPTGFHYKRHRSEQGLL